MRGTGLVSVWLIAVSGALWLGIGAAAGIAALLLCAVPGALMLGAGVRLLLAPDARSFQLAALGSVLGGLLSLPLLLVAGPLAGLQLLLASAGCLLATGWAALRLEPELDEVPAPPPGPVYAAKVAADDALLGVMTFSYRAPDRVAVRANAEELGRCHELFARRGWLEKPEDFHRAPTPLVDAELVPARARGTSYEQLRFVSDYEPDPELPVAAEWMSFEANRTAIAHVFRDPGTPRPWLVNVHGFGMGSAEADAVAFRAAWLRENLGINVALYVLPVHAARAPGRRSGEQFMNSPAHLLHAEGQAIWELRRLIGWLRARQDAPAVGVSGMSLGGYTVGVLAGLEDGLACAIAGVPPSDFVHTTTRRFAGPLELALAESVGHDWEVQRAVERVVSPLAFAPRLEHSRRFVYGATGDRLVPAAQVRELWRHWDRPRILWSRGSHVSCLFERDVREFVAGALRDTLF